MSLECAYIFMLHVFEEPQLSVGSFGKKLGLEGSVEFLDGHLCPRPTVPCWTVSIKRTFSRFFCGTEDAHLKQTFSHVYKETNIWGYHNNYTCLLWNVKSQKPGVKKWLICDLRQSSAPFPALNWGSLTFPNNETEGVVFFVDPHPHNTMQNEALRSQLWTDHWPKYPTPGEKLRQEYYSLLKQIKKSWKI